MSDESTIKLSVEIKDGRFIYEYEIGEEKQHSNCGICADSLVLFADLLRKCATHSHNEFEREMRKNIDELGYKAYLEKQGK